MQVVARAHAAGRGLTVAPADEPFTPGGFAALVARAPRGERRYVSLVPTQLHRLVEAADAGSADGTAALDALRSLDAVLLGGAATPPALLRRARSAGARVVTTYGMTETCGGCVYDGVPLPGARVRLVPAGDAEGEGAGVVELSGQDPALRGRGLAATVSGAGPTGLALSAAERLDEVAGVADELVGGSADWSVRRLDVDTRGVVAERL